MKQAVLTSFLLGAGASIVAAHPHAGHHGHCGRKCSASSYTSFPTTSLSSGAGIFATGTASAIGSLVSSAVTSGSIVTTSTASSVSITSVASAAGSSSSAGEVQSATASADCTFTDAESAISGKTKCTNIVLSNINVPAGKTLDLTDLSDGTTLTFEGTTSFGYEEWEGPLISVSGTKVTVQGAAGHIINMEGQEWWDGKGDSGKTKPKGFEAHDLTDSIIKGLNIKNTPVQCFSINGASNLHVIDVTIDNSAGDGENGGHNTDAFDVGSSTGVYISGATVHNQDDCLAINSGTDISFTNGYCSGGHGLSIGSVGGRDDNTVENIYIADSNVTSSANGLRIKTIAGETGSVKNVTYSGITLSDISDYGIVIEQDYKDGGPSGTPTAGIPITDITINGVSGSVSSDANPYYVLCAACSDWTVTGTDVTGGSASSECKGAPGGTNLC